MQGNQILLRSGVLLRLNEEHSCCVAPLGLLICKGRSRTERERFELSGQLTPANCLAGSSVRPLRHLSKNFPLFYPFPLPPKKLTHQFPAFFY